MTTRLPSELTGSIPRDVELTRGGIAAAIAAVALAVGAVVATIVMSIVYSRSVREADVRARAAVTLDATIDGVARSRGEQRRTIVTYRYDVDGKAYTGRATYRRDRGRAFVVGGRLQIAYVPSRPEASWPVEREPGVFPVALIPLMSMALLALAGAVVWTIRRQWVLLSEGRPALARVVAQKKVQGHDHKFYRITCEFETLSGARQTVRVDTRRTPPALGTRVPVVYHRDKPQRMAMYPLGLVRPIRAATRRS